MKMIREKINVTYSVVEMGKIKCIYAFDWPQVQRTNALWILNFKNKLTFIVEQLAEKRAPNRAVYTHINIFAQVLNAHFGSSFD